jgi:hypothetical protein
VQRFSPFKIFFMLIFAAMQAALVQPGKMFSFAALH